MHQALSGAKTQVKMSLMSEGIHKWGHESSIATSVISSMQANGRMVGTSIGASSIAGSLSATH
jgi:hypothetical protein